MELLKFLKLKEDKKQIVCIDFGSDFIKLAFLETRGNNYILLAYALKEFQVSQKTAGEIGACLKQILETNSITEKKAYLSISDPDRIFIKKLTLPQMPKDELLAAVKWQLKGDFPFSPDESAADLQIVRQYSDSEDAQKAELFCVFAKKEIINKYIAALAACGLEPVKISSSVFNYRGILDSLSDHPKICAIFDLGYSQSNIAIYQENKLSFIRSLDFSTAKLSAALAAAFLIDNAKIEISQEELRQLIRQYGILRDEPIKLVGGIKASQIIARMRPLLETAAKELSNSFEYFKSESGLGHPEVLYLTGGGANLKNLDTYLAGRLKIKIAQLPLPESLDIKNVDAEKFLLSANQLSGVLGLGLSIPGMNLLPPEISSRKSELLQRSSLRVAAIAIGAAFVFSWGAINLQISDYRKRLRIARLHLQGVEEIRTLKQAVELKEDLISRIQAGKVPAGGLLKLIGAVTPASVMLDEFDFNQASRSLRLKGIVSAGKDSVEKVLTDFMNNLENSKFVLEANLINSKEANGINSFEIKCNLAR